MDKLLNKFRIVLALLIPFFFSCSTIARSELSNEIIEERLPPVLSIESRLFPHGTIVEFTVEHRSSGPGSYIVQRKYEGSEWADVSGLFKTILKDGFLVYMISEVVDSSLSGVQYRATDCNVKGCSPWSSTTTPIDIKTYNRDISDANANEIRDDVEALIDHLTYPGGYEHAYAMYYAHALQELVDKNYNLSADTYINMVGMTEALICTSDPSIINHVKSVILDSNEALDRYLKVTNEYVNSRYSNWDKPNRCTISPVPVR
ncbi:hypothetical protein [Alteromonas sp. KUL49]|uniref:hypothetical protein n=1 Tax=Alteromonas sp. KUL49 TaxID=2480798 RepID=UPI00102F16BC|nr:hypothetical protein [Alteromonas sp. KUL49]TAP40797.1 hypothetical protein EYS00_06710 [Alteromonas sp. KUL49]GEA10973.1 hypothetical protein KUL49_13480 [Alteromonas sp. KUL49]